MNGNQCASVVNESLLECGIDIRGVVFQGIIEGPLEISTIHASSKCHYLNLCLFGAICSVGVHDIGICVEIIVHVAFGICFRRRRNHIIAVGNDHSIKIYRGIGKVRVTMGYKSLCSLYAILERLDNSARFLAKSGHIGVVVRVGTWVENIGALHRNEHGILAIAEVIPFGKNGRTSRSSNSVLGITIIVVVVDMGGIKAYPWMAGVRVIVPVMVVGNIEVRSCIFFKPEQVGFAAVPEVIVRKGDIGG